MYTTAAVLKLLSSVLKTWIRHCTLCVIAIFMTTDAQISLKWLLFSVVALVLTQRHNDVRTISSMLVAPTLRRLALCASTNCCICCDVMRASLALRRCVMMTSLST